MAERWNEVETAVNAIVDNVAAIEAAFVTQKSFVLFVDVSEDGTEAVGIIDGVTETGRVHNRQSQLDSAFFDLNRRGV